MSDAATHQWAALSNFALRHVVPVLYEDPNDAHRLKVIGTGTLCRAYGGRFLVTAEHVAKWLRGGRGGLHTGRPGGGEHPIPNGQWFYTPEQDEDVAVLSLPPTAEQRLVYDFLDVEHSSEQPQARFVAFAIVGFPSKDMSVTEHAVSGTPAFLRTQPYDGKMPTLSKPLTSYDRVFHCPKEADEFKGVSGGTVWGVLDPADVPGTWSPHKAVRPVAVENAILSGTWFRCSTWGVADELMRRAMGR